MNLQDMEQLVEAVATVDRSIRRVSADTSYDKHIREVLLLALQQYRVQLVGEFEHRHDIDIEI